MNGATVRIWLAAVLAGTSILFALLGIVYNLFVLVLALPIGFGAYLIWADITGRGGPQGWFRSYDRRQTASTRQGRRVGGPRGTDSRRGSTRRRHNRPSEPTLSRTRARNVLGVDSDATDQEIKQAYRDRVKQVHPDQSDGDEEAFKRVNEAYERLVDD